MKLTYSPPDVIGIISHGMSRETVRKIVNRPYREFQKSDDDENTSDHFVEEGVQVYYFADNTVDGVEVYSPSQVEFNGTEFLARPIGSVLREMAQSGEPVEMQLWGATAVSGNLRIGVTGFEDGGGDAKISSVCIYLTWPGS